MIAGILWAIVRYAWPWLLAATIWGVQEGRITAEKMLLASSHKREIAAQSQLDDAHKRATDLALLYASMLPKIDDAAKAQEAADHDRIASLQQRVDTLSRAPTLHFSAAAIRVWGDVAPAGNAAAPAAPASGAPAVSAAADAFLSEADIVGHDAVAAAAYRDAVSKLHECRDLYNSARNAQINALKGAP